MYKNIFKNDLPVDSTMGGIKVANTALLKNPLDLDFGFINKKYGYELNVKDGSDIYSKVCSIDMSGNDNVGFTRFRIVRVDNSQAYDISFIDVSVKATIQGDKDTGDKSVYTYVSDSKRLYLDNIKTVITKDNATGYTIEVYFKHNYAEYSLLVMPMIERVNLKKSVNLKFYNLETNLDALPSGTEVDTTGGAFDFKTMYLKWNSGNNNFDLQDSNNNNIASISNTDDNVPLYDNPIWDTGVVKFVSTSIFEFENSEIISIAPVYRSGSILPYTPILKQGSVKSIAFFNWSIQDQIVATDAHVVLAGLITLADDSTRCMITLKSEKR